jgi:hypothetical protein
MRAVRSLALGLALFGAIFSTAAARSVGTPSISVDQATPAFQTGITFTTTDVPSQYDCVGNGRCARIEVLCSQVGTLVYGEAGGLGDTFLLGGGGSRWIDRGGGPADCIANLFRFDNNGPTQMYVLLASTSFPASGA